ncbi:mediator of RNA polymerase II transcription subunit 26-like isoform X2 [Puntigrus tetrazona]|uniref:mediator of RNA polymerase II transcription subunit 26-like isoform X2 n=1 Tax=Puntigrus tetrazona TaxID=1606681 RepID=UPI001C8903E7|nr:mediator of RNA polymerase II transcription subunit 26-like isoform X2 [Puntigrus tetrazona]
MKRASSRPQQLKDQLLQAIDSLNNIQNMMAFLDVICCLEKHPMTKEALMETRLGKLINDVRKRCTDEDLVKRLKSLIRRWQRLVEVNEVTAKELSSPADNSTSAECVSGSTHTPVENYSRARLHSATGERTELSEDSVPAKTVKYPNNFRKSKIPIRAIKPYSSSIKRISLSDHHSQNANGIAHQHKFERNTTSADHTDEKRFLAAKAPGQSTPLSIASNLQNTYKGPSDLLNILKPATLNGNLNEVSSTVSDANIMGYEDKTSKKRRNIHTAKVDGEDKLAFDPRTQQIKPVSSKTLAKDCQRSTGSEIQDSEHLKNSLCLFEQRNFRRETSQSKMIQNSLLTPEKAGMSFSLGDIRKTHGFIPEFPVTDLPGVSREVTERDLIRMSSQRWHGVNGCYDNGNNWYDWTQSFTLDPYGDGSKLKILPYVGIDYRL